LRQLLKSLWNPRRFRWFHGQCLGDDCRRARHHSTAAAGVPAAVPSRPNPAEALGSSGPVSAAS